jgi:ATP-binding cassette subfamily B protein/subfamily B ATP-binding cassette protein MsbA
MRSLWPLLRYARPHTRDLVVVLGAMLAVVALEVLRPWPLKLLVDQVLDGEPLPPALAAVLRALPGGGARSAMLAGVAITTVAIFVLATIASTVQTVASVRFGQRMVYDLAGDLFLHLQRLSLVFHSRRPVGDMIARVTGDSYAVQLLVNGALLPLVASVLTLASMFIVMWRLEPTLTMLALAVVPFLALAIRVFGAPMRLRARERLDREGILVASVQQTLSAIPVVQAFTRETVEHDRFRREAGETVRAYERQTLADMAFKLVVGLVTALGTAAVIWLGGRHALDGRLSTGEILVFVAYLAALYGPLSAITYTTSTLEHAAARADRIAEILDTPSDVPERPDALDVALRGHVRFERVTFGYDAAHPVLRDVSLDVRPGEVVAIVGPSGAGKTTLAGLLLRFFDPQAGRVTIDGYDVRDLRLRTLREQIAIVLQEPFIFPLSVAENIGYGRRDASTAAIAAAAVAASAADFVERLPQGYDTIVGERGMTLSGGEKQRLALARAFLKPAPILVLDEPTSALDARTEAALLDAVDRLVKGRTTFIIAHRLSTIRRADRIVVVDRGAIVEQGSHDALLARDGLYASLWRRQMLGAPTTVAGAALGT